MDTTQNPAAPTEMPESLRVFMSMEKPPVIAKLNYSHTAMIDEIIRNPHISQGALAGLFGYTAGWISQVIATDAFQAAMHARKEEIIDPVLRATVDERLKGLVLQSIDKLMVKMEGNPSDDLTLGVLTAATKALGYGAKNIGPVINQQFVVQVPGKIGSSSEWAELHNPAGGKAVTGTPIGIQSGSASNVEDAVIVTADKVPVPAPSQSDADRLLRELIS